MESRRYVLAETDSSISARKIAENGVWCYTRIKPNQDIEKEYAETKTDRQNKLHDWD